MDIRHIEHFLQLVKYEHMSQTADFLNITQPTLSKSIALLEAEIGTKLFDRTGNRIRLNQNGKVYLQYAEKAMDLLKIGSLAANNIDNAIQGEITFLNLLYPRIIASCAAAYSKINPYVTFANLPANHKKEPDFILCSSSKAAGLSKEKTWLSQPLFKEKYRLVASPRYRGKEEFPPSQSSIPLASMREERFIAYETDDILIKDLTHAMCQDAGFFPKIFYKTNDFYLKMRLVDEGCAIAIIPECCLSDAIKISPDVRCYSIEDVDYERTVYIRRKRDAFISEVAQDFWEFLLDYFHLIPDETCPF